MDTTRQASSQSSGATSTPDFYQALVTEALVTLRQLTDAARVQAQAINAQAALVERLMDVQTQHRSMFSLSNAEITGTLAKVIDRFDTDTQDRLRERAETDRLRGIRRQVHIERANRTREGRAFDEPSPHRGMARQSALDAHLADGPSVEVREPAEQPASPVQVEIIEKPIPEVDPHTALDASGRLVPAAPTAAEVEREAFIERSREETEQVEQEEAQAVEEDVREEEAEVAIADVPQPENPKHGEGTLWGQAVPALVEEMAETASRRADPKPVPTAPPPAKPGEKATDRILNHYAEHGMPHDDMAMLFGVSPSTIASYISQARTGRDKRAAKGDGLRMERQENEEAGLKADLSKEASDKSDLIFFDDDQIGTPAYVVNYPDKQIETPHGILPMSPAWLRVMDILKDRDTHPCDDVTNAGRFMSERAMLKQLRTINEALAAVKLYIVADATTYQICGLR